LAPFPAGDYGSDVAEAFGSIHELYRDPKPLVSELVDGAYVDWTFANATDVVSDASFVLDAVAIKISPINMSERIISSFFGIGGCVLRYGCRLNPNQARVARLGRRIA
jgi:hypothetical protein